MGRVSFKASLSKQQAEMCLQENISYLMHKIFKPAIEKINIPSFLVTGLWPFPNQTPQVYHTWCFDKVSLQKLSCFNHLEYLFLFNFSAKTLDIDFLLHFIKSESTIADGKPELKSLP